MNNKDLDKRKLRQVNNNDVLEAHMSMMARRAFLMRQAGSPLFDIAEELGLTESTTRGLLKDAVSNAAALVSEGAKADLLALEVTRLDALQAAAWGPAMQGDPRAIDSVLKVISERVKVLGLDKGTTESTHQMVVIQGDDGSYLRSLKEIVTRRDAEDDST